MNQTTAFSPRPATGMTDDFFRDPLLRRLIEIVLRRTGVPAREIDDVVQDVYEALVRWSRKKGAETAADLRAGARDIADKLGKKYWKKTKTRGKRNVGPTGDADDHAPLANVSPIELMDVSKVLAEIHHLVESQALSSKAAAILVALAEETTLLEHAEETHQSHDAVKQAHARAHRKVVRHLEARGMLDVGLRKLLNGSAAVVAIAIVLIVLYTGRLRSYGHDNTLAHQGQPSQRPSASPVAGDMPLPPQNEGPDRLLARTQAATELQRAEVAYKRMEWALCIQHVELAKQLDPSVGDSPELENACAREDQKDANAKAPRRRR